MTQVCSSTIFDCRLRHNKSASLGIRNYNKVPILLRLFRAFYFRAGKGCGWPMDASRPGSVVVRTLGRPLASCGWLSADMISRCFQLESIRQSMAMEWNDLKLYFQASIPYFSRKKEKQLYLYPVHRWGQRLWWWRADERWLYTCDP